MRSEGFFVSWLHGERPDFQPSKCQILLRHPVLLHACTHAPNHNHPCIGSMVSILLTTGSTLQPNRSYSDFVIAIGLSRSWDVWATYMHAPEPLDVWIRFVPPQHGSHWANFLLACRQLFERMQLPAFLVRWSRVIMSRLESSRSINSLPILLNYEPDLRYDLIAATKTVAM